MVILSIIASIIAFLTSLSFLYLLIKNRKSFHFFSLIAALGLSGILVCEIVLEDHVSLNTVKYWFMLNQMLFIPLIGSAFLIPYIPLKARGVLWVFVIAVIVGCITTLQQITFFHSSALFTVTKTIQAQYRNLIEIPDSTQLAANLLQITGILFTATGTIFATYQSGPKRAALYSATALTGLFILILVPFYPEYPIFNPPDFYITQFVLVLLLASGLGLFNHFFDHQYSNADKSSKTEKE
ncbi:MAG: hypothetical protein JXA19_01155 [Anaerolineales bacterium]|nr:hypothetical protein [Anaerolineales bacterium]